MGVFCQDLNYTLNKKHHVFAWIQARWRRLIVNLLASVSRRIHFQLLDGRTAGGEIPTHGFHSFVYGGAWNRCSRWIVRDGVVMLPPLWERQVRWKLCRTGTLSSRPVGKLEYAFSLSSGAVMLTVSSASLGKPILEQGSLSRSHHTFLLHCIPPLRTFVWVYVPKRS